MCNYVQATIINVVFCELMLACTAFSMREQCCMGWLVVSTALFYSHSWTAAIQLLTMAEAMVVPKHPGSSGLADGAHCLAEVNA